MRPQVNVKASRGSNKVTRRVTLGDVAKAAGVSVMTVSNVVNGKTNLVKVQTLEHVQGVISRLGYRPNTSARSLRLSQARSVGIVIADTDPTFLTDPFISHLVSGLSNYLSTLEYTLDVQGVAPERFEKATILSKVGNDAFCAILCGAGSLRRRQLNHLQSLGQPVVVFQEVFASSAPSVAFVRQDDAGGGRLLAEHLRSKKGIRSILFLRMALDWCAVEQRELGLREAIAEAGSDIAVETMIAPSERFEDVYESVKAALSKHLPSAIVAVTDSMAVAALKACEELGLAVPADVLITGFNGFDVWRHTSPTLTTVVSPAYEMGRSAGELLVRRLGAGAFSRRRIVFPVSLQVGESS